MKELKIIFPIFSRNTLLVLARFWMLAIAMSIIPVVCLAETKRSQELNDIWQRILKNPRNAQNNIDYGDLAEKIELYDKAASAYERILFFQPDNELALQRLERLKLLTKAPETSTVVILSASYGTNASLSGTAKQHDLSLSEILALSDERRLGSRRWRSSFVNLSDAHSKIADSDLLYNRIDTGPVVAINKNFLVVPKLALELISIDNTLDSHALELSTNFEAPGPYLKNFSVGLKRTIGDENDKLKQTNYFGNAGFETMPNIVSEDDVLTISVSGELNRNDKGFDSLGTRERYSQIGADIRYALPEWQHISLEPSLGFSHKYYHQYQRNELERRKDFHTNAGIEMSIYPPGLGHFSFSVSYNYAHVFSNDNDSRYTNNTLTFSTIFFF